MQKAPEDLNLIVLHLGSGRLGVRYQERQVHRHVHGADAAQRAPWRYALRLDRPQPHLPLYKQGRAHHARPEHGCGRPRHHGAPLVVDVLHATDPT